MNAGAPTCGSCGGVNTNPQSSQCRFCGQMLQAQAPQGYGAAPGYGGGYGAPPMQPMQQGYGGPPPGGYGGPYGGPLPPQGYAPGPYGGPAPNPYGQPMVQPFQGGNGWVQPQSGWSSGWSSFFWIRLGIAAVVVFFSLMGACVQALSH